MRFMRETRDPSLLAASSAVLAALLLIPPTASAVDGTLEISPVCAAQTGCFAGDAAGFPVTISASGSYRLTSDLVVPDANTTAIQVTASDVSLDLNGFAIVRSGCQGVTFDCTPPSGSGFGVQTTTSTANGVSVSNGSVVGMGSTGISVGTAGEVYDVRLRWNRTDGVFAGALSTVRDNVAHENGFRGLFVGTGSTVSGNTVSSSGSDGIVTASGCTVSGNTASFNGGDGLDIGTGSTVVDNTAYDNDQNGIRVNVDSAVQRNTVRLNSSYGLSLSSSTAYRGNVINDNGLGTVSGGINMFSNSCNGTSTCP